ncbi:MAG: AEC family transporter [Candidatus Nitrohelix vancouverensis]|uniref:AEC family transporter n=1 Tax=Candidatus Nitrohelix vancouverensis TaxID=2705534 RepID=A0A7T0G431_9BACT|nr:MAG: AEC family transporter [Candidatus Nitrohelix vancouverensis]
MIENFYQTLGIVSPAFILIALGFLYNSIAKSDTQPFVRSSMNLLVPAFAFYHIIIMRVPVNLMSSIFLAAWIVILGSGLVAFLVFRVLKISNSGLYLPIMFMNTVNLPFPILMAAYGEKAVSLSLMFYLAGLLGAFTIGILIVSVKDASTGLFKEPVLYVLVLGFALKYYSIEIPELVMAPLKMLESATVPLVLITLGMQLSQVKITELRLPLIATLCRIGGGFLVGLACVYFLQLEGLPRVVVLFNSIMPSAVIGYLIAQKYDKDGGLVASTVLVSTLVSIFLIPLALIWLK